MPSNKMANLNEATMPKTETGVLTQTNSCKILNSRSDPHRIEAEICDTIDDDNQNFQSHEPLSLA